MDSTQTAYVDVLSEGYRQMAADQQREAEAEIWSDTLIPDTVRSL